MSAWAVPPGEGSRATREVVARGPGGWVLERRGTGLAGATGDCWRVAPFDACTNVQAGADERGLAGRI